MRLARASVVSSLTLVVACAAAPPEPAAPPAPTPVEVPSGPAAEPAPDPRVVRCGVDDRPRSVVSEVAAPTDRARLFEAPFMGAGKVGAPPTGGPVTPRVTATVDRTSASFATFPDLDACEGLATVADEVALRYSVELSVGGAPLRVRPPAEVVSPYARCVQERLCGLDGGPASQVISVPVSVKWNFARRPSPRPPPDGATVAPRVTFARELPAAHARHAYARALKSLVHHAATVCGTPSGESSLIVTVTLDAKTKITAARAEATGPEVPPELPECVAGRMRGEPLPTPPAPRPSGDVVLVLDW